MVSCWSSQHRPLPQQKHPCTHVRGQPKASRTQGSGSQAPVADDATASPIDTWHGTCSRRPAPLAFLSIPWLRKGLVALWLARFMPGLCVSVGTQAALHARS